MSYKMITALNEPEVGGFSTAPFSRMARVAKGRKITHFLESSDGCANRNQCPSRLRCYAGRPGFSVPTGNIGELYRQQFDAIGTNDVGIFMSGYSEPAPEENKRVRDVTKTVLDVMINDSSYKPNRGMRFQTQSPGVVKDERLFGQLTALNDLMPFYVGISAPSEHAVGMFEAAEKLQSKGIEVQLCAAPAMPTNVEVYANKIAELNPATVLYEPQHNKYDMKAEMPGKKIVVPMIDEFRQILRGMGYKGSVEDKNHTFTLLTPSQYLN